MKKTHYLYLFFVCSFFYSCSGGDGPADPGTAVFDQEPITVIEGRFENWEYGDSTFMYMGSSTKPVFDFVYYNSARIKADGSFRLVTEIPPAATFVGVNFFQSWSDTLSISDTSVKISISNYLSLGNADKSGSKPFTFFAIAENRPEVKTTWPVPDTITTASLWVYADRPVRVSGILFPGLPNDTIYCDLRFVKGWNRLLSVGRRYYKEGYWVAEQRIENRLNGKWYITR